MDQTFGYRNRRGEPIDLDEWGRLFEDFEGYRLVERTDLPNGLCVKTIWEGIVSPAVEGLFFTGVCRPGEGQVRFKVIAETPSQTEEEARRTHAQVVERWK